MSSSQNNIWKDSYKIEIKKFDEQHKKLFSLLGELYALDETNNPDDIKIKLRKILYNFINYMQTHFEEEEEYMLSIGFTNYNEHKQEHERIMALLSKVIQTPANLNVIKSKMRIVAKRALIEHITHQDVKISLFLLQKNEEIKEEIFDISHHV